MRWSRTIVTVGPDPGARLQTLLSTFEAHGFHVVHTQTTEGLCPLLREERDAVVVVYDEARKHTARRVLTTLAQCQSRVPVIVVVDRPDYDEYINLMCDGAFDYFEVAGDPRWIERSLEFAAAKAA